MTGYFEDSCAAVARPAVSHERAGTFWRMDPPILDAAGRVIKGGMWPHQRTWWEMPNFIKLLVGGYGSGKTLVGSKRAISLALANAPCPVATVSPTFPVARRTMITTISELLDGKQRMYGGDFYWRYNSSIHEFTIRYHGRLATIIVYSGDNPMSLRGPNLAAAIIDEPFMQEEDVFTQMIARVRHPDASLLEVCCTGTPEELNWGYDLCVGELRGRHDVGAVHASTRANLALGEGYVQRLSGALTAKAAEAYIEGKFVNLSEGLVYYGFDPLENVAKLPLPDNAELGCGMDFNVNPMAATVFWRAGSHVHYFDEIELPNADTEYMCSFLAERYGNRLRDIYPDASGSARKTAAPAGRSDFWYIKEAGYNINAKHDNPKRRDRFEAVNGKLKPKEGKVTLTVDPACKKLIKYLSLYSHEQLNTELHKRFSHLLDAFSYPIAYLFPIAASKIQVGRLTGV